MGALIPNKNDLDFIFALLTNSDLNKKFSGSTIPHIYFKDYGKEFYLVPVLSEQYLVGRLFKRIDHLITLHQRKVFNYHMNFQLILIDLFYSWEQRKLGELGEFKSNGVDKLSRPDELPVNLLNYMDVYNRRSITNENCNELMQVTAKPAQKKDNNVLENDVFFTPTSETADDIGHVMVIEETLQNTVYSYHLMRYRPYGGSFYKTYPNYACATNSVRHQMALMAQGVQRFVLSKNQFENISIMLPESHEQEKIASLLTNIDNLITLHQRKGFFLKQEQKVFCATKSLLCYKKFLVQNHELKLHC